MSLTRITTKEGETYFVDSKTGERVQNEKISKFLEMEKIANAKKLAKAKT